MARTRICMLGTRGSVAVHGDAFQVYGGATSCVLVEMGGEHILLDGGTGILSVQAAAKYARHFTLLLSHAHTDHLLGLPMFPAVFDPSYTLDIYAARRQGLGAKEQLALLMRPPLWPCGPDVFHKGVHFMDLPRDVFNIGPVRVDFMEGNHPGGCTVFRLTYKKTSIVYCTDFEHGDGPSRRLVNFARDCSLLIYDAQYTQAEYLERRGFGHSTWRAGVEAGRRCGAKRIRLFHHDPSRTDEKLARLENALEDTHPDCSFARNGEEVFL